MAQPVTTVTLGGTDISAYVASAGGTSLTYSRGANFDGSSEGPGTAVVTVQNSAKTFNPANASSPLASVLKIGKEVRCSAVYSATTYGLFHGYLRRIIPLEGGFAELHCEDALWKYGRVQISVSVGGSSTISYNEWRELILTQQVVESATRMLLAGGIETSIPLTNPSARNVLDVLDGFNEGTGSIHWVKPDAASPPGYVYTVRDRTDLQTAASVETFTDTDLATPFAVQLGGYDYTDEAVVNSQTVMAHPYDIRVGVVLWAAEDVPFTLPAGAVREIWPLVPEHLGQAGIEADVAGGGTTILDVGDRIELDAGGSDSTWTRLEVIGYEVVRDTVFSVTSTDATSVTAYGTMAGSLDSDLIGSGSEAKGLADWIIYRYKNPQARPTMTVENRFPGMLQREVGDRITLTSSVYSISARQYFIRQLSTTISDSGARWQTTYQLEEAPAVVSAFTIGGSAAQGVGGTGILGY